jgi:hypothetical protein
LSFHVAGVFFSCRLRSLPLVGTLKFSFVSLAIEV